MSKLLSKSLDLQLREGNRLDTARRKSFAKQSGNDGVLSLTKLSTYAQPRHDIDQENGRPVGPSARSLHRVSHVQICARQVSRTLRPRNLPQMQHKQKPPQYTWGLFVCVGVPNETPRCLDAWWNVHDWAFSPTLAQTTMRENCCLSRLLSPAQQLVQQTPSFVDLTFQRTPSPPR